MCARVCEIRVNGDEMHMWGVEIWGGECRCVRVNSPPTVRLRLGLSCTIEMQGQRSLCQPMLLQPFSFQSQWHSNLCISQKNMAGLPFQLLNYGQMLHKVCRRIVCTPLDLAHGHSETLWRTGSCAPTTERSFTRKTCRACEPAPHLHQFRGTGGAQCQFEKHSSPGGSSRRFVGRIICRL